MVPFSMAHGVPKRTEELESIPEDSPETLRFTQDKSLLVKPLYLCVKGVNIFATSSEDTKAWVSNFQTKLETVKYH